MMTDIGTHCTLGLGTDFRKGHGPKMNFLLSLDHALLNSSWPGGGVARPAPGDRGEAGGRHEGDCQHWSAEGGCVAGRQRRLRWEGSAAERKVIYSMNVSRKKCCENMPKKTKMHIYILYLWRRDGLSEVFATLSYSGVWTWWGSSEITFTRIHILSNVLCSIFQLSLNSLSFHAVHLLSSVAVIVWLRETMGFHTARPYRVP